MLPDFVDEGSEGEEKWCEALRALAGASARPATRRMCGPVSWSLLSVLLAFSLWVACAAHLLAVSVLSLSTDAPPLFQGPCFDQMF